MYKINYKNNVATEDVLESIESIEIDVRDISLMRFVNINNVSEAKLIELFFIYYKECNGKFDLTKKYLLPTNASTRDIIRCIISCNWLINRDDVIHKLDKLEETKDQFYDEIDRIKDSRIMDDMCRVHLMQAYLATLRVELDSLGLDWKGKKR